MKTYEHRQYVFGIAIAQTTSFYLSCLPSASFFTTYVLQARIPADNITQSCIYNFHRLPQCAPLVFSDMAAQ